MAAPLTNQVWIYGDDDDTLFRLITLGTGSLSPGDAFQKQGYTRKGSEAVVGPMPPFGEYIKTDDDLWKIIAWMRSVNCERRAAGCSRERPHRPRVLSTNAVHTAPIVMPANGTKRTIAIRAMASATDPERTSAAQLLR